MAGRRPSSNPIDWELVEREYRMGQCTLRQLGATHGVDPSVILRRAKSHGWVQDKREVVKARSEAQLLKASGGTPKTATPGNATPTDRDINVAATVRTNVILAHRRDAGRARALAMTMIEELEVATKAPTLLQDLSRCFDVMVAGGEIPPDVLTRADGALRQALTLGSRASVLKSLSESLSKVVAIEREAFGINDPDPPPTDPAAGAYGDFQAFKAKFLAAAARFQGVTS